MHLTSLWKRLLRRELLALFLVIYTADIVVGYILLVLPLRARELGASLLLIGSLTAFNGATQVTAAVPLGLISDRLGRRHLIAAGCLFFALSSTLLALAPTPLWLLLAQMLLGLGVVCVFAMGAAMVGDYAAPSERGVAMGILTTAMGLGFATGPLLGGLLAESFDIEVSLLILALVAIASAALAWITLVDKKMTPGLRAANPLQNLRVLASSRPILLAALANLLISPVFSAVVVSFLPIHASTLGFSAAAIGGLYTLRGLLSTLTRVPLGVLSTPRWSHRLMVLAIALSGVAAVALASWQGYVELGLALVVEGISYGMFLTAGQAFITQHAQPQIRGAALGAYNMAGGIGITLSPFLLGAISQQIGLSPVFLGTGVLLLAGALLLAIAFPRALAVV